MKNKTIYLNWLYAVILLIYTPLANAAIKSEAVTYNIAAQSYQGYFSYDDAIKGKRPGVLVVHEWWGHNAYARKRAEDLAKLGYAAFALDMYGQGKLADHPKDAQKYMEATLADLKTAELRFNEAMKWLQNQAVVEPDKIAAIGYCFGGAIALHMAKIGTPLKAVASFHGSLSEAPLNPRPNSIKTKILVLNGADDSFITPKQIEDFKKELNQAKANYEFINYLGAKHSFTNPEANNYAKKFDMPLEYNTKADQASWKKLQELLSEVFK